MKTRSRRRIGPISRTFGLGIISGGDKQGVETGPEIHQFERATYNPNPMAGTIMIVEDEPAVARGVQVALEREGHTVTVREVRASVGAGFITPILGEMRTMPGLGRPQGS